jgi:hypothetical protein
MDTRHTIEVTASESFPRLRTLLVPAALAGSLLLSGCASGAAAPAGSAAAPASTATTGSVPTSASTAATPGSAATSGAPSGTATAAPGSSASVLVAGMRTLPAGFGWHASSASAALSLASVGGGRMTLLWMDPTRLRFRFVPGYQVPEGSPSTTADRTPSTWVSRMVAGFDAGYKLADHVGGYYYLGRTVAPLRPGYASLVVHRDGTLAVGVWGRDIAMTSDTVVVRQNLRPLVVSGVSRASVHDTPRTWGISNGNRALANRSALGRLADGSFVFIYGHDVTAATLASTLVRAGVVEAIMLDMNISWPTGFVYTHRGSSVSGARINSHIVRPPSTYLKRFKKDFVVVESR